MGLVHLTYPLCGCKVEYDAPEDFPATGESFVQFLIVCNEHEVVIAANPEQAWRNVVAKEATDFSYARQAIIDAELNAEWDGTDQNKVDAEQDRLLNKDIVTAKDLTDLGLMTLQKLRIRELENSPYTISGTSPNRVGQFDVIGQTLTNSVLDSAIALRIGAGQVTTTSKIVSN